MKTACGPWWLVGLTIASAAGCRGTIGEEAAGVPGDGPGGGGAGGTGAGGAGTGGGVGAGGSDERCDKLEPIPRRLWRLSVDQYANAVRDLLGLAEPPAINTSG